jgi:predicted transcriptional regulator
MARPLTRREREIMDVVYRLGRATALDVVDNLEDPPSYSAVRALLRLLEEHGHVTHTTDGSRYVYAPAVPRGTARRRALEHLISTFFEGSVEQTLSALVESSKDKLSNAELDRLAEVVERARKRGK